MGTQTNFGTAAFLKLHSTSTSTRNHLIATTCHKVSESAQVYHRHVTAAERPNSSWHSQVQRVYSDHLALLRLLKKTAQASTTGKNTSSLVGASLFILEEERSKHYRSRVLTTRKLLTHFIRCSSIAHELRLRSRHFAGSPCLLSFHSIKRKRRKSQRQVSAQRNILCLCDCKKNCPRRWPCVISFLDLNLYSLLLLVCSQLVHAAYY